MVTLDDRLRVGELLAPEISELIGQRQNQEARSALVGLLDPEIADVLMSLDPGDRAVAFRLLPRARAADVLTFLPSEEYEHLLSGLNHEQLVHLIDEMDPDDRASLFEEMPGQVTAKLLAMLPAEERRRTQVILGYPPSSVGRIMTPEYLAIRPHWTVQQTLEHIRAHGRDAETINRLYIVDDKGRLIDDIRLRQILLAELNAIIESMMDHQFVCLHATDDREEAVRMMERYDYPALPVVDSDSILVGIVTFDDVADVAEIETTEDIHKMAGMAALEHPYLSTSLWTMLRKRGGWLALLFMGQMLTATAMERFEGELQSMIVLAIFIPLIISSGGNSGSQATSLIIRAMAVGEVTLRDWRRVMGREALCGLMLGLFLGVIGLLRVAMWHLAGWYDYTVDYILVAMTVAVALVGVVSWGTLMGSMLPFLLRRLGLDPATSSAPFVATLVDVTGLVIYFVAALLLLGHVLG